MRRLSLLPSGPFLPTASELHRAAECVAPWALGLPESEEAPGEWAEYGRRMHGHSQSIALLDPHWRERATEAERLILRHVEGMVEEDRASIRISRSVWCVELGIKWRTDGLDDEAAFCERRPGERLRGWFSGTADLVYVRADGVLVVADWKFGAMEHLREPADDSCQGFFLALAFCTLLGITASSDAVVVARFERRIVRGDGIEVDAYDITWGDVCQWRDALHGLAQRIGLQRVDDWRITEACNNCKSKAACPAQEAQREQAQRAIVRDVGDALRRPPQCPEDVHALHNAIEKGEHLTAEWKRQRDAWVLVNGPVPIGLGLELKAVQQSKRSVVATPESMDLIEAVAGNGAIVVERSATCDSIKKAVRDAAGKGIESTADRNKAKARAEADTFAKLIEGGAIRESGKTYVVREVRANETEE